MASPSSLTSRNYRFDVFPSFRGRDVRETLRHMHDQFKHKGISMFDDQKIVKSEEIATALTEEGIRESRISIVVLSEKYASSSRCLNELVEILKCRENMGKIVMTVFYGVDPSDVQKQTGNFGMVFNETCASKTEEERRRWSQALEDVGNIAGEVFFNWENEANMIEKIAKDVSDKLLELDGISTSENEDLLKRHGIEMDVPTILKNLEDLEIELQDLCEMRNELQKMVSKEEGRGLEVLPEVKGWISTVGVTELKANCLLDKSISERHKLSKYEDCSQIFESTHRYIEEVHRTLEEVKDLKSKGGFELVVDRALLLHAKKMQPLQSTLSLEKLTLETRCSSPEEAWDVFQEIVGENTLRSHPDIPHIARVVASKCGCFSFALYLIGVTMSSKRTAREWRRALHVLASSAAKFPDTKYEILPILKLSCDSLPGEEIRSCFLFCALFPKNEDIRKPELVDCLIGEGIIADEEDRERSENKGYEMMGDLVRVGLLMEDKSGDGVKMHEVVRELALWIASDFGRRKENFVVVGGVGIHQIPEVHDWKMVKRMSVTCTEIENISDPLECSELTTLFLQENNLKRISGEFFRWMTSLVVLNLSRNRELSELPEEVSCLVSLRLLTLSWTGIIRLPLALKKLTKLIHLDLDDTPHLREIDVIASLLNLQVLRLFRSVAMDLRLMDNIQLLKSLQELSVTVSEVTVLQRLLIIHRLASCIQRLQLRGITITKGGVSLLNAMLSLRELHMDECEIQEITIDCRNHTIQKEAVHSGNVDKIPQFRNMRTVSIIKCKGLRDLTWLLYAPNLEDLKLVECPQMEQVVSKEKAMEQVGHTSEHPFQNLISLYLLDLPQLESIYWAPLPFPVMECMQISRCPKLRRLPLDSESAKGNQVRMQLEEEWIKGVEWEDEATKQRIYDYNDSSLLPYSASSSSSLEFSDQVSDLDEWIKGVEEWEDEATKQHFSDNNDRSAAMVKKFATDVTMSKEEEEEIRGLFMAGDVDNDGFITEAELLYAVTRNGANITEDDVKNAIKVADMDGDGRLSYDDFVKYKMVMKMIEEAPKGKDLFTNIKLSSADDKSLRGFFMSFDKDNDGFITAAEFLYVLKNTGVKKTDEDAYKDACRLIKIYDVVGNGRLNYDEFVKVMIAMRAAAKGTGQIREWVAWWRQHIGFDALLCWLRGENDRTRRDDYSLSRDGICQAGYNTLS